MEIDKFLVLSTAHIKPETAATLDADNMPFTVWRSEYGYFLCARHAVPMEEGDSEWIERIPLDLRACMNTATGAGCEWLRLDGDGPQLDGLPVYEWEKAA